MKFDCGNKFDLCNYGPVNSLQLKSRVASKRATIHLWGVPFNLLAMVPSIEKINGTSKGVKFSANRISRAIYNLCNVSRALHNLKASLISYRQ